MNKIKCISALLLLSSFTISLLSQNFSAKIKQNASVVITVNGKNLMNKISKESIHSSFIFNQFKKEFKHLEINELSDLGFDFHSDFTFALEVDTNFMVNLFFVPIDDLKKVEQTLAKLNSKKLVAKNGFKQIFSSSSNETIAWNKVFAVYIKGKYIGRKFQRKYDYYSYQYMENEAVRQALRESMGKEETLEQISDRVDVIMEYDYKLSDELYFKENEPVKEEVLIEEMTAPEVVEIEESQMTDKIGEDLEKIGVQETVADELKDYSSTYHSYYEVKNFRRELRIKIKNRENEIRDKQKMKFLKEYFSQRLAQIFNKNTIVNSISEDKNFKSSQDNKADAIVFLNNNYLGNYLLSNLYNVPRFMRPFYGFTGEFARSLNYMVSDVYVSKFYFEKEGMKFINESINGDKIKARNNKIYTSKQDERFLKYLKGNDFIGFVSNSFNSKSLLEEMPKLMQETYSRLYPKYEEEQKVLAEMVSTFLDEEAISKLATGNSFFVLKDLKEVDVTYTTYEYDENYKSKQVQRTKKELIPDFLMMFATENSSLLTKLLKISNKNKLLEEHSGGYFSLKSKNSDLPMDIFFAYKDGIAFISSDEPEIISILKGGEYSNKLTKKQRKSILNNSLVVYYNNEKLIRQLPEKELRKKDKDIFDHYRENGFENVLITSKNNKGNSLTEGFVKFVPNKSNGAQHFFYFLDQFFDIVK